MSLKRCLNVGAALTTSAIMMVAPASGAELPGPPAVQGAASSFEEAQSWQHYRHRNHRYRYRYRRGPSAGDIITGVLVIGAIAAIADAATDGDDRRYRNRDWTYPDRRNDRHRQIDRGGIDRAIDMCVDQVERDRRVESVDRADRTARGWHISGALSDGQGFSCRIGPDGRIDGVDFGTRGDWQYQSHGGNGTPPSVARHDRQWDNSRYAAEWARLNVDRSPNDTANVYLEASAPDSAELETGSYPPEVGG
ncbi:MAG: hypothetical protein DI637_00870 [Citromicrobium sp.]|nr:MAG: hypothetical protein DI637_00870 [Citromicrobium sp.]